MPPTLFVSDLHLCPTRPATRDRFLAFLAGEARDAAALYILGDLFESWAGDDDLGDPFNAAVSIGLRGLADHGAAVHFMAGNRDFLVGQAFAVATGAHLLEDPALVDIGGTPTLLLHGDTLCTGDLDYQRFRTEVRSARWRDEFLALPLAERKARIEALRRLSEAAKQEKAMALMDVDAAAVAALFRAHGVPPRMIHGHTHRPAHHRLHCDGQACERWVLAAWDDQPSCLVADAAGCRPLALGRVA